MKSIGTRKQKYIYKVEIAKLEGIKKRPNMKELTVEVKEICEGFKKVNTKRSSEIHNYISKRC